MFDELQEAGVEIRFTNANGPGNIFALARNHKKLYVIDDAGQRHDLSTHLTESAADYLVDALRTWFDDERLAPSGKKG